MKAKVSVWSVIGGDWSIAGVCLVYIHTYVVCMYAGACISVALTHPWLRERPVPTKRVEDIGPGGGG